MPRLKHPQLAPNGLTLIEILVAVAVLTTIAGAIAFFQKDALYLFSQLEQGLRAQGEARRALRQITTELRQARPGADGAYPLADPQDQGLIFFADTDGDALPERVRYFVVGNTLRRGATSPALALQGIPRTIFEGGTNGADLSNFPANNSGNGDAAQTFTTPAGAPFTLSSVELLLARASGSTPSDIFLEIRSASTIGPVLATSATLAAQTLPTALTWTAFALPTLPTLQPSTLYALRLRSIPESTLVYSGSQGTLLWGFQHSWPSGYALGDAYRYVGRLSNPNDAGQILDQYDFSFRIYEGQTVPGQWQYNLALETVQDLAQGLIVGSTPFFQYYSRNANGALNLLTQPVIPSAVRAVQLNLSIDLNPARYPAPLTLTTYVAPRELLSHP